VREVKEETDLDVDGVRILANTYDRFPENDKHYVTWFVLVELRDQHAVPRVMEPEKCASWHWMSVADLRGKNMFLPLANLFEVKKTWDAVLAGSAPLIRLPASAHGAAERNLLVRWDVQPGPSLGIRQHLDVRGCALQAEQLPRHLLAHATPAQPLGLAVHGQPLEHGPLLLGEPLPSGHALQRPAPGRAGPRTGRGSRRWASRARRGRPRRAPSRCSAWSRC